MDIRCFEGTGTNMVEGFYENEKIPSKVLQLNSTPDDNEVILLEFSIKGLK